jgi:hypothetical protein
MTIGSAASQPSHELAAPLPTFQSLDAATRQRSESAPSGGSDAESENLVSNCPPDGLLATGPSATLSRRESAAYAEAKPPLSCYAGPARMRRYGPSPRTEAQGHVHGIRSPSRPNAVKPQLTRLVDEAHAGKAP